MITRRQMLKSTAGAGAALALGRLGLPAQERAQRTAQIPSSGEQIPMIGLGSARTFSPRSSSELPTLREVLRLFHEHGGRVFDTAPTYGRAERISGGLAQELSIHEDLFLATKISTGGGRRAGQQQEVGSREAWGRETIDLNQVHNLWGVNEHLATLRESKQEGRVRYIGVTTSRARQFERMEEVLRAEEDLDFVQLNYSIGERQSDQRLIPLARDRGVAVLVNEPFNAGRLFGAVRGQTLPEWAAEFDCESWGQFFLKYIISHPGVTVVIPATSDPEHLVDNMGAGLGRLPDVSLRGRMETWFDDVR